MTRRQRACQHRHQRLDIDVGPVARVEPPTDAVEQHAKLATVLTMSTPVDLAQRAHPGLGAGRGKACLPLPTIKAGIVRGDDPLSSINRATAASWIRVPAISASVSPVSRTISSDSGSPGSSCMSDLLRQCSPWHQIDRAGGRGQGAGDPIIGVRIEQRSSGLEKRGRPLRFAGLSWACPDMKRPAAAGANRKPTEIFPFHSGPHSCFSSRYEDQQVDMTTCVYALLPLMGLAQSDMPGGDLPADSKFRRAGQGRELHPAPIALPRL